MVGLEDCIINLLLSTIKKNYSIVQMPSQKGSNVTFYEALGILYDSKQLSPLDDIFLDFMYLVCNDFEIVFVLGFFFRIVFVF